MKITGSGLDGFIRSVQSVHSVLIMANTVNSETFAIILFSRISLKDIFVTFKNLRQGHDFPLSVNIRVLFSRNFACGKIKLSRKFLNLQYSTMQSLYNTMF